MVSWEAAASNGGPVEVTSAGAACKLAPASMAVRVLCELTRAYSHPLHFLALKTSVLCLGGCERPPTRAFVGHALPHRGRSSWVDGCSRQWAPHGRSGHAHRLAAATAATAGCSS